MGVKSVAMLSLHSSPLAAPGTTDVGGMNLYVQRLANDLGELGVEVDVFTRRTDPDQPVTLQLNRNARVIHLGVGPLDAIPKRELPMLIPCMTGAIATWAHVHRRVYDVLHSHYWISGMVGCRLQAQLDVPLVHMFHTLGRVKEHFAPGSTANESALRADGERCVMDRAALLLGCTSQEAEFMERLYGRRPREYAVIPPGVDLAVFRPEDQMEARTRLGLPDGKIVLFTGRQDPIKGFDRLLQVLHRIRSTLDSPVQLVVVGGHDLAGHEVASGAYNLINELELSGAVHFRGNVSQQDLVSYYCAADVCAIPSAYESFGMVALEAMACQVPVVAFRVGGLAETVLHERTGYLAEPNSVDDFAIQLTRALRDEGGDAMRRRARLAVQRYSWEIVTARTLDAYRKAESIWMQSCGVAAQC